MVESNKTYIGIVEDNNDETRQGKVRVRVMDVYDDIKTEDLPWASPWKDINGNSFNIPDLGKVVIVIFENGNINNPEYIYSDHYNINLENKLSKLSDEDYNSMKSIIFDHKTQIYVNDSEGLKIDYKYNNINISDEGIDLNLKDNQVILNLGDNKADQQAILGNHFLDWLQEFLNIMKTGGLINTSGPCTPTPSLYKKIIEFEAFKDLKFLSNHINLVDNDKIKISKEREDLPQYGDSWTSTKEENTITSIKEEADFKPVSGPQKEFDTESYANVNSVNIQEDITQELADKVSVLNGQLPLENDLDNLDENIKNNLLDNKETIYEEGIKGVENSLEQEKSIGINSQRIILESPSYTNEKLKKILKYLESKNYNIYREKYILNIVAMREHDDGKIRNNFADTLYVFYKDENYEWVFNEYKITTLPGAVLSSSSKKDLLPKNVSILSPGQYVDQCIITNDKNDSSKKCLKFQEVAIFENKNQDKYNYDYKSIKTGDFDLYLKGAKSKGNARKIYNHSHDGSQVFSNSKQWKEFFLMCENQLKYKKYFTYTLCRKKDFNSFNI